MNGYLKVQLSASSMLQQQAAANSRWRCVVVFLDLFSNIELPDGGMSKSKTSRHGGGFAGPWAVAYRPPSAKKNGGSMLPYC